LIKLNVRPFNTFVLFFLATILFCSSAFAASKDIKGPLPPFFQDNNSVFNIKFEDNTPKDVYSFNVKDNQSNTSPKSDSRVKDVVSTHETVKDLAANGSNSIQNFNNFLTQESQPSNALPPESNNNKILTDTTNNKNLINTVNTESNEKNSSSLKDPFLATPSSTKDQPNETKLDIMGYLTRFFVFLVLLVLIPMLIIKKIKGKFNATYYMPKSSNSFIRVIDRVVLSYSELLIVEVMDKYFLLSISKNGEIKLLKEFDTIGIFPEGENSEKKLVKSSFLEVLRRFRQEVKQLK